MNPFTTAFKTTLVASLCIIAGAHAASLPLAPALPPHYNLAQEVAIPGDEGWDYLSFDGDSKRLFITHGSRVQVLDTRDYKVVGEIGDTPGVHGVAIANALNRAYISAGRSGMIVVVDLKSLARLQEIKAGDGPDAVLYDSFTKQVFSFNGRSRNVTIIDAVQNKVLSTLAVDAKPEFGVSDEAGHVYVNLEDRNTLAVIDAKQRTLEKTWPLTGCEEPSGLAIDRKQQRLFSVCSNKTMMILDASSGRIVATVPIGAHVDGVVFDPVTQLAFASCGDGTMTVVHQDSADHYSVVQTIQTKLGARTVTLDEATHRVYTATAKLNFNPDQPQQRPTLVPSSFTLLVLEPAAGKTP